MLVKMQAFELESEPCPSGRKELVLLALVALIGLLTAAAIVLPALLG